MKTFNFMKYLLNKTLLKLLNFLKCNFVCVFILIILYIFQEYSEWKKESTDVSLPGVYIGLMDRLQMFSRVVKESTKEMCDQLQTLYPNKLKEKGEHMSKH